MKLLIIGSEGFIGSNLVQFFLQQGNEVIGCDVTETSTHKIKYQQNDGNGGFWNELFKTYRPEVCINAAGSGNVSYSIQHPQGDFEANCFDVFCVLDAIRQHAPSCKYVHLSSAAVYGNPKQLPVNEDDKLRPLSPYGWHKLLSEHICREHTELYNLRTVIIRPFSVYGNGLKKQLLWDVCKKLEVADKISLFGTGNESRDFIHISDLVQLINIVIEKSSFNCEVYNAACGVETTIKEIADLFVSAYEDKYISFSGETKEGDPINWRADINKIKSLGFAPSTQLEEGIANYISWYKATENA